MTHSLFVASPFNLPVCGNSIPVPASTMPVNHPITHLVSLQNSPCSVFQPRLSVRPEGKPGHPAMWCVSSSGWWWRWALQSALIWGSLQATPLFQAKHIDSPLETNMNYFRSSSLKNRKYVWSKIKWPNCQHYRFFLPLMYRIPGRHWRTVGSREGRISHSSTSRIVLHDGQHDALKNL